MENLDKLIVEENYLQEQIFNIDETSLFCKRMSECTFIHKEAKSMSGFKVCTLYDVRTTTKSPSDSFLERIVVVKQRTTVITSRNDEITTQTNLSARHVEFNP